MRWIASFAVWTTVVLTALLGGIPVAWGSGVGTDPPSVIVRGVAHFSPEQVTRQLDSALWRQAVYGVAYGWEDPTVTLPHMTVAAYRKAGFRDVVVRATRDMATAVIELEVEEGRQIIAGTVRVEGATQIAPEQLIARLAERTEPDGSRIDTFTFQDNEFQPLWVTGDEKKTELLHPLWLPGRPVVFDVSGDLLLSGHLARVFADLGYPQAKVHLGMSSAAEGALDLVVRIEDEGPRQTGDFIEVVGIERNTREEVLAFLQIQPGIPLDRKTRIDLTRRLWQSARFTSIDVATVKSESQSGTVLRIALAEYEKAPPLRKEFTEAEQVAVRLHEWVARLPQGNMAFRSQGNDDGVATAAVFAPGRAIGLKHDGIRVLLAPDRIGYYSDFQSTKLQMTLGARRIGGQFSLNLDKDRSENDSLFHFGFQGIYRSEHETAPSSHLNFALHVPPVLCLALLNGRATEHAIEDGVLSIRSPKEFLRIEVNTGRLLEFRFLNDDGTAVGTIETLEMPFQDNLPQDWAEVASYEDAFDSASPVSTFVHLAVRDLKAMGKRAKKKQSRTRKYPPELGQLLIELADGALLATVDDFVKQVLSETQEDRNRPLLEIPNLPSYLQYAEPEGDLDWYPLIATNLTKNLFPENSWMADHALAMSSAMADYDRMEKYYSRRVFAASEAGPLRDVSVAAYLQQKDPGLAHLFAERGLALLDLPGFHRDRNALLDESAYTGRFLLHAAEILKRTDEKGIEALQMSLFDGHEPGLTAALVYLRYHKDQPAWQTLPEALDIAWETGWRAMVETKLKKIEAATRPK